MKKSLKRTRTLVLTGSLLFIAVCFWAIYAHYNPAEVLFCEGKDSASQEMQAIRYVELGAGRGHIRVFKKTSDNEEIKYDDAKGLVYREGEEKILNRLSLKLSDTENLQVYRECGTRPVCRFEHVNHVAGDVQAKQNEKVNAMQQQTFLTRKKAAILADKYSALRKNLADLEAQMKATKDLEKKRNLAAQLAKTNAEANEIFGAMNSLNATAFDMHRQTEAARENMQAHGTKINTTDLEPSHADAWCSTNERPKTKF